MVTWGERGWNIGDWQAAKGPSSVYLICLGTATAAVAYFSRPMVTFLFSSFHRWLCGTIECAVLHLDNFRYLSTKILFFHHKTIFKFTHILHKSMLCICFFINDKIHILHFIIFSYMTPCAEYLISSLKYFVLYACKTFTLIFIRNAIIIIN